MNFSKISPLLLASLDASISERERSDELNTGYNSTTQTWSVILRYSGDFSDIYAILPDATRASCVLLLSNYAILETDRAQIELLSELSSVIYMEKPKRMFFEVVEASQASCIPTPTESLSYSGKGVLVGIVDSGIDYTHPDFRNPDGSSRILALWDQTISPDAKLNFLPPTGYTIGTLFLKEQIDFALKQSNPSMRMSLCPSQDISGHGTLVTGIAAGNGRASDGLYRGVAYEADLVIVKLSTLNDGGFPNTIHLMEAANFCVQKALSLQRPMALNLSFGNTYGPHSGTSLVENFFNELSQLGMLSIVTGSGNEGSSQGHFEGKLSAFETSSIPFTIGSFTPTLNIQLWKYFWDEVSLSLSSPLGLSFSIPDRVGSYRFSFGDTDCYVYVGEPAPYSIFQEIYIDLLPKNSYILSGIWTLRLTATSIKTGEFALWMPAAVTRNISTGFLYPSPETTLTIPSTASSLITVGAYDSRSLEQAPFSGRGYTFGTTQVKPDLVAPGVDITSCAPGGAYTTASGTSFAAPFVTGSCACCMQWGILEQNVPYLYGEKMKAYLIRGTKKLPYASVYPNPSTGWGALCLRNVLL